MIKQTVISEMEARGQSINSLAKEINSSYPTIYNFLKKDKGIRFDILERILKYYNLRLVKTY